MRGVSRAVFAIVILAAGGCAQAPPPAYPAPADRDARPAYADALRASLEKPGDPDEGPPEGQDESYIEAMARGGRIARAERTIENNRIILTSIETLRKAEPSGCTWTRFDLADATDGADDDAAAYPVYVWHCSLRIVHDTDRRGRVEASTDGWFFREGARFVYVGKAAHGFKRSVDIERGVV